MRQTGYRVGMLCAGAGALVIAQHAGWFAAYATMAGLLVVGLLVFLFGPEPAASAAEKRLTAQRAKETGGRNGKQWLSTAVIGPLADFMRRPIWPAILVFVFAYKVGEGMAAVMATPLYISLGFSLT